MGNSICYLINIRGTDFNWLMRPSHQAPASQIDEMINQHESNLWEGLVPNNDTGFLVDLTGFWTLCKLPFPYSFLLQDRPDPALMKAVEEWQKRLRGLCPTCEIIRVDDFLVDQWNSRYDYLLIRDPLAIGAFIEWLRGQDRRHWSVNP